MGIHVSLQLIRVVGQKKLNTTSQGIAIILQ